MVFKRCSMPHCCGDCFAAGQRSVTPVLGTITPVRARSLGHFRSVNQVRPADCRGRCARGEETGGAGGAGRGKGCRAFDSAPGAGAAAAGGSRRLILNQTAHCSVQMVRHSIREGALPGGERRGDTHVALTILPLRCLFGGHLRMSPQHGRSRSLSARWDPSRLVDRRMAQTPQQLVRIAQRRPASD